MQKTVIFSARVINTLKSLPESERHAVAKALTTEFVLGEEPTDLSPVESMLYSMIRFYAVQDNMRFEAGELKAKQAETAPASRRQYKDCI